MPKSTKKADGFVSLPAACRALALSWTRGYALVMTGKLEAKVASNGRYLVSRKSLERLLAERAAASSAA
jgi:hypothetical protein